MENDNNKTHLPFDFLDSVNIPDPFTAMSEEERKKIAAMIFYASGNREALTHDDPLVWVLAANRAAGLEQLRLKKELDQQHLQNMQRLFEYQQQEAQALIQQMETQREKMKNLLNVAVSLSQEIAGNNETMSEILAGYESIVASVKDTIVLDAQQQAEAEQQNNTGGGLGGVFAWKK